MKILIFSSVFYPLTGGMETVAEVLANGFAKAGHEVDLVTNIQLPLDLQEKTYSFKVYRRPSFIIYWKLVHHSDVTFHNCISLKQLWPDLLYRNKFFVMHQTWYRNVNNYKFPLATSLKRLISRIVNNCYISKAIQLDLGLTGRIIPNTYDPNIFSSEISVKRDKEFVFLGRLVSDKGVQVLLEALKLAKDTRKDFRPNLTIIGSGPERSQLEDFATDFLNGQVSFTGQLTGVPLATVLNRHQVMVVPSLWEEPFGIVALEGLACGCLVIGSEKGGLRDAIGPCGWTFPNGDAQALADLLLKVWNDRSNWEDKYSAVSEHLYRHQPQQVINQYLEYFNQHVSISD